MRFSMFFLERKLLHYYTCNELLVFKELKRMAKCWCAKIHKIYTKNQNICAEKVEQIQCALLEQSGRPPSHECT